MNDLDDPIVPNDNLAESATGIMDMHARGEPYPLSGSSREHSDSRHKNIAQKFAENMKASIKNLVPIGKDTAWWTGYLSNIVLTSAAITAAGPSGFLIKSAGEFLAKRLYLKGREKYYQHEQKRMHKHLSGEELAHRIGKMQKEYHKGTERTRKFFGGMAAGAITAGIGSMAIESVNFGINPAYYTADSFAEVGKANWLNPVHTVDIGIKPEVWQKGQTLLHTPPTETLHNIATHTSEAVQNIPEHIESVRENLGRITHPDPTPLASTETPPYIDYTTAATPSTEVPPYVDFTRSAAPTSEKAGFFSLLTKLLKR